MRLFGGLALLLLTCYSPILIASLFLMMTGSMSAGIFFVAPFFSYLLPVIIVFATTGLILDQVSKLRVYVRDVDPYEM